MWMHNRKEMPLGRIQGTVSKETMPLDIGQWQPAKRMPEASDKGSQPYRKAFRFFEMAGMGLPPII